LPLTLVGSAALPRILALFQNLNLIPQGVVAV
jgi:hypothetical protein